MSNNTPPKEIQFTESFPFIVYKGCIYSYNSKIPEGATILNAPNIDTATGYVSEEYHNEMLAEKDKEIEKLKAINKDTPDGRHVNVGYCCPKCKSPEIEAFTPKTVYSCGSSDYDQRPDTFVESEMCKEMQKKGNYKK